MIRTVPLSKECNIFYTIKLIFKQGKSWAGGGKFGGMLSLAVEEKKIETGGEGGHKPVYSTLFPENGSYGQLQDISKAALNK
jgi:hypothetical protein